MQKAETMFRPKVHKFIPYTLLGSSHLNSSQLNPTCYYNTPLDKSMSNFFMGNFNSKSQVKTKENGKYFLNIEHRYVKL
ncbi:MAG: hypothetical protein JG770_850 [Mahella sp.]|nr:hypothetical protein [Mahella sp.]